MTDDSGTVRSSAGDALRVLVNAAPIADAGPDQVAAPGQTVTFSGQGRLIPMATSWAGNGNSVMGRLRVDGRFRTAMPRPEPTAPALTVRDDTGQPDAVDYDEALVFVNAPPLAMAGPDLIAAPGVPVRLNGCDFPIRTVQSGFPLGLQ